MARTRDLGDQVWALHLALAEAALIDPSLYSVTADTADYIEESADNREEGEALTFILTAASPLLPPALVQQARIVASQIWGNGVAGDTDAKVDAWLRWLPDSGEPPPETT